MSLFDEIGKQVLGNVLGGQSAGDSSQAMKWLPLAVGLINQMGGLDGLLAKLRQSGLSDQISGWIGSGENPAISSDQIKSAFGEMLPSLAEQAGTDPNTAASGLAQVLPSLIDKLTPHGEPSDGNELEQNLQSVLRDGLGKFFS